MFRIIHYNCRLEVFVCGFGTMSNQKPSSRQPKCLSCNGEVAMGSLCISYLDWTPTSVDPYHPNLLCMCVCMNVHPTLSAQHVTISSVIMYPCCLAFSKRIVEVYGKVWMDNMKACLLQWGLDMCSWYGHLSWCNIEHNQDGLCDHLKE